MLVSDASLVVFLLTKHNFGLLDMYKNLSSIFFDLDIENPLSGGTLAKFDPPCNSDFC